MIFVENDFYLNFKNAVKSNDEQSIKIIFIDQISKLVANNRGDIISLLEKVKIGTSDNPSNEEIVEKIVDKIKSNVKLRAGLAFLICENNEILYSTNKSNRIDSEVDNKENSSNSEKKSESADAVTFIAVSLAGITEKMSKEDLNEFKKEITTKTNVKAPNFSKKSYIKNNVDKPKNRSKKWIYIALGLGALGLTVLAYKKGWLSSKKIDTNL